MLLNNKCKVIDERIVEVKQETKDKIAAEKAQKEAELKVAEEAKKKAEEEAQAKAEDEQAKAQAEAQAKIEAEEQAKVQEEQVIQQNNQTQMVWKSETGSKYHSISNCGRMNPNNATHITLEQAQSFVLGKCSKGF